MRVGRPVRRPTAACVCVCERAPPPGPLSGCGAGRLPDGPSPVSRARVGGGGEGGHLGIQRGATEDATGGGRGEGGPGECVSESTAPDATLMRIGRETRELSLPWDEGSDWRGQPDAGGTARWHYLGIRRLARRAEAGETVWWHHLGIRRETRVSSLRRPVRDPAHDPGNGPVTRVGQLAEAPEALGARNLPRRSWNWWNRELKLCAAASVARCGRRSASTAQIARRGGGGVVGRQNPAVQPREQPTTQQTILAAQPCRAAGVVPSRWMWSMLLLLLLVSSCKRRGAQYTLIWSKQHTIYILAF